MAGFLKRLFGGGDDNKPPVVNQRQSFDLGAILETVGKVIADPQAFQANALWTQVRVAMGMPADPTAQYVKKTKCANCGGAKTLPPKSAYVYCDFCGSLTDYDFPMACTTPGSGMPGPAYEALLREMHGAMAAAKQTKDADTYRSIQRTLYSKWVELCPKAVSPRISDPEYREGLIDFMAECSVANDFDPRYQQYAQEVQARTAGIRWDGFPPMVKAESATFRPLYETVKEQVAYSFDLLESKGILAMHPDEAPRPLQERMLWSMFAQGWLPYLTPEDSEWLIRDTGLGGEYTKLEPKETTLRHCGTCGGDLEVVSGAKAVICEDCGTRVDVQADEINCTNCGGLISFPVGRNRTTCPFCKAEAQRMAW